MTENSRVFDQQIKEATQMANGPSERVKTLKQKTMKTQQLL